MAAGALSGAEAPEEAPAQQNAGSSAIAETPESRNWHDVLTPSVLLLSVLLLLGSAFFSGSEVAFYSLHRVRLRAMADSAHLLERLAAGLMEHPGGLLTSILMGNSIVNVLLGVVLGARVERLFAKVLLPASVAHPAFSYTIAVVLTTTILVFFGEIMPKLLVVRIGEAFVRFAAVPIYLVHNILIPIRVGLIQFVGFLFRITRFSDVQPAPFMTDEEFKALLSEGEASGIIEEDERQMIQGILEFGDVRVKDILVPRPDMVAIPGGATVQEALQIFREHEYSRIPVYGEDVDDIKGILYAKDLLQEAVREKLQRPVRELLREAQFVPETMSVADFMKTAQRLRAHMAIAVDEFGGTEGLVTLHDALREVIGDIGEDEEEEHVVREVTEGEFRVDGGFPLDELEETIGLHVENGEHTTVAGLLMEHTNKPLEVGDEIEYDDVTYTVEAMDDKRVEQVSIQVPPHKREPRQNEEQVT